MDTGGCIYSILERLGFISSEPKRPCLSSQRLTQHGPSYDNTSRGKASKRNMSHTQTHHENNTTNDHTKNHPPRVEGKPLTLTPTLSPQRLTQHNPSCDNTGGGKAYISGSPFLVYSRRAGASGSSPLCSQRTYLSPQRLTQHELRQYG